MEGTSLFAGRGDMRSFILALFGSIILAPSLSAGKLADFELRDQHGTSRTYCFPKAKVTVMTLADQKGSQQLEPWIAHVYRRFGKDIDIDGVADVSSVPRPLQGMVRFGFRAQLNYSVMLDWDGSVARAFDYRKNVANVYVINRNGVIIKRLGGAATRAGLLELTQAIDRAIRVSAGG